MGPDAVGFVGRGRKHNILSGVEKHRVDLLGVACMQGKTPSLGFQHSCKKVTEGERTFQGLKNGLAFSVRDDHMLVISSSDNPALVRVNIQGQNSSWRGSMKTSVRGSTLNSFQCNYFISFVRFQQKKEKAQTLNWNRSSGVASPSTAGRFLRSLASLKTNKSW